MQSFGETLCRALIELRPELWWNSVQSFKGAPCRAPPKALLEALPKALHKALLEALQKALPEPLYKALLEALYKPPLKLYIELY